MKKENKNKIEWTDEQQKIIGEMINQSEDIGWVQGHDDAINEIINEFEKFVFELKSKFYRRKE